MRTLVITTALTALALCTPSSALAQFRSWGQPANPFIGPQTAAQQLAARQLAMQRFAVERYRNLQQPVIVQNRVTPVFPSLPIVNNLNPAVANPLINPALSNPMINPALTNPLYNFTSINYGSNPYNTQPFGNPYSAMSNPYAAMPNFYAPFAPYYPSGFGQSFLPPPVTTQPVPSSTGSPGSQ